MWGSYATGESHSGWVVTFFNISVTQGELGWQTDENTRLGAEPYDTISVTIDAGSGELISRAAYQAVNLGVFVANTAPYLIWLKVALIVTVALVAAGVLLLILHLRKNSRIQTDL